MKVKFNTRIITANYLSEPICISRNWDVIKGSKYGYVVTYEGYVDKVGREGEREKLKSGSKSSRAGVGRKYLHALNCRVYKRLGTATFRPAGIRFNPLSGRGVQRSVYSLL